MNRQKILLGVLGLLLGLSLVYAWRASPRQERVAASSRAPSPSQRVSPSAVPSAVAQRKVRLEIPAREEEAFLEPARDIFQLSAERPTLEIQAPPTEIVAPPPPTFSAAELSSVEAPAAASPRFTFLGFLEKDAKKKVFLSLGNEIFIVRQGERFGPGQEFEVEEITPDKLVVRQGDIPVTVSLAVVAEPTPVLSRHAERLPLASGHPRGRGKISSPVFPVDAEAGDEEGGGAEPGVVVEEPPVENEPPADAGSRSDAEEEMSTLQLRSTIQ